MSAEVSKIAIVGAGRVGATLAYALARSRAARDVALIDRDEERAEGEAMDIAHAVPFHAPVAVASGSLAQVAGAAVTVIAAGAAQKPGESRVALAERNAAIVEAAVPRIVEVNPDGIILVATNPVDALTWRAWRLSGLPPARVFGSGTVLDTARLRSELAGHFAVDARNVHAYVLGEHGDSEFAAWSSATLANVPIEDYCRATGMRCSPNHLAAIEARVRHAAYEIIRRKGATNFAIAAALTRIIEAVVRDEAAVLTVSTVVDGAYGIRGVCLGLPAIVDRGGVRTALPLPLSDAEQARLRRSADAVRETIGRITDAPAAAAARS